MGSSIHQSDQIEEEEGNSPNLGHDSNIVFQDDINEDEDALQVKAPEDTRLFLRHRSPSLLKTASYEQSQKRQEIHRILTLENTEQKRHVVPFFDVVVDTIDEEENDEPGRCWWCRCEKWNLGKMLNISKSSFPSIQECQTYAKSSRFVNDIVAGCTVAITAIPLSMSYAKLAGLPAYYGLYAMFLPPMIYPFFGSSKQLAVGPAALVSLLVSTAVAQIVEDEGLNDINSDEYIARYTQLSIQCGFLAGLINLGMGLLRLGFVTQFLSKAVISGFVSGAAFLIAASQIKHLFGYDTPSANRIQDIIKNLVDHIDNWNWKTFTMGLVCIAVLVGTKNLSQNKFLNEKYPNIKWVRALSPIIVSVLAIIFVFTLDLEDHGIPIVGNIPAGLPSFSVKQWTPISSKLLVVVISMVIVGFVQSIAVAKRIAYKRGYEIDSSQELIGLGLANLVGSMFQSYPSTGALGQSAISDEIGAETGVASFITGLVVMLVLLFLTPVFEKMPLSVLAAIVVSFVLGMFDYPEAIYLYKVHRFDFAVWIIAFIGTMLLGVEYGLGISVTVSLLIVIYESALPKTVLLGRLPGTSLYHNVKQYPTVERYDGLVIVRIDTPLYFANALNVRDKLRKYKRIASDELKERDAGEVKYIILDLTPVSHMDTTALRVIEDMYLTQQRLEVQICFCNPGISVTKKLLKSGVVDLVGREHFFPNVIEAVQWCLNDMESPA